MKWIYFFDDINQYLEEDEKILWARKEIENLLKIIPKVIRDIVVFLAIYSIFVIFSIITEIIIGFVIIVLLGIAVVITILVIAIGAYKERIKIPLSRDQLREYEFFYVITTKRYIRKDYYYHYERDFSKYPEEAFDQIGDTVFLNFSYVNEIVVDYIFKRLNFQIKDISEGRDFFLEFKEKEELGRVIDILQTVLPKENFRYDL
ncbi:MAG: hypothetical protein ACFFG0_11615 [Candidatus Thorarchaeota archaeon]